MLLDSCSVVLENAAYDITEMTRYESFSYSLKSFLESEEIFAFIQKRGSGFSLGLPATSSTPPINITSTSSREDINFFRSYLKKISNEEFTRICSVNFISKIVNKDAIKAWENCMMGRRTDIFGDVIISGKFIDVSLRWNKISPNDEPPVVERIDYSPLEPVGDISIQKGTIIDTDGKSQRYLRTNFEEVTIALDTTRGPWHETIPSVSETIPVFKLDIEIIVSSIYNSFYLHGDGGFIANAYTPNPLPTHWIFTPNRIYLQNEPNKTTSLKCEIRSHKNIVELSSQTDYPNYGNVTVITKSGIYNFPHNKHRYLSLTTGMVDSNEETIDTFDIGSDIKSNIKYQAQCNSGGPGRIHPDRTWDGPMRNDLREAHQDAVDHNDADTEKLCMAIAMKIHNKEDVKSILESVLKK